MWTVEKFLQLLKRHGSLVSIKMGKPCHIEIEGWFDLESVVRELNETCEKKGD